MKNELRKCIKVIARCRSDLKSENGYRSNLNSENECKLNLNSKNLYKSNSRSENYKLNSNERNREKRDNFSKAIQQIKKSLEDMEAW
jgi:hypothetical protein